MKKHLTLNLNILFLLIFIPISISPNLLLAQQSTTTLSTSSKSRVFEEIPETEPFGASYFINNATTVVQMNQNKLVPGTYILGPGDVFLIKIKGIVNEDHQVEVNSRGVLSFGKVQSFLIAGLSFEDAREKITTEVMNEYKNVTVEAEIVDLKNIDVTVTGNAQVPGIFTLRGNSTFLDLMYLCGGPSTNGSFRNIDLIRNIVNKDGSTIEQTISVDLYNAFLLGSHTSIMLESGDNISVPSVSNVSTIFGEVKQPARYEWKDNITLQNLISMSGGFSPDAAINLIEIQRSKNTDEYEFLIVDYQTPSNQILELQDGDIVRIPNRLESISQNSIFVTIVGRVNFPGTYYLPKGSALKDLVSLAGGLKDDAFFNGVNVSRELLNESQNTVMEKVVRDMEAKLYSVLAETTENAIFNDDQKLLSKAQNLRQNTLQSLGTVLYEGRLIFDPEKQNPILHDGDEITIPSIPNSVNVIGAVFNSGSFSFLPNKTVKDYLQLVGGLSPMADTSSLYIIKPYGYVIETPEENEQIENGDTIVIPFDYNLMSSPLSTNTN